MSFFLLYVADVLRKIFRFVAMRVFLARSSVNSSGGFYRLLPATRFSFEEPHCTFVRGKVNKNPKTFWHAWLSPIRVSTDGQRAPANRADFAFRPDLTFGQI
jgi:hypothetical protein